MAIIDGNWTRADLRESHRTEGAFNKVMRMDAGLRYKDSGRLFACKVCGETREVDICHIRAVEEYSPSALVSEVNGPDKHAVGVARWRVEEEVRKSGPAPEGLQGPALHGRRPWRPEDLR